MRLKRVPKQLLLLLCAQATVQGLSQMIRNTAKRKNREGDESGYHSEDPDDDSTGLKKPSAGRGRTGTKRSCAAEVHNLSERRRRDRINEKMRALQELIPNCNKVDKASMLDEAIEYLKTLQLQVQEGHFCYFRTFSDQEACVTTTTRKKEEGEKREGKRNKIYRLGNDYFR